MGRYYIGVFKEFNIGNFNNILRTMKIYLNINKYRIKQKNEKFV